MTVGTGLATPVCLIIHRRPETTRQVLAAIRTVRPRRLFVVADGPRPHVPGEAALCRAAREAALAVDWDCAVTPLFAADNLGLRHRVRSGLDAVFAAVPEAIILEDDCRPDPTFFGYAAELLERYRDDPRVMLISGDNAHGVHPRQASYAFTRYALIWGWATWRRAWALYDDTMADWPERRAAGWLETLFPGRPRAVAYWREIFDDTHARSDSWARAWVYACFKADGLCAIPGKNLVANIGFGPDSTHTANPLDRRANVPSRPLSFPLAHPRRVAVAPEADAFTERRIFSGADLPVSRDAATATGALADLAVGRPWRALSRLDALATRLPGLSGPAMVRAAILARRGLWDDAQAALTALPPDGDPDRAVLVRTVTAGRQEAGIRFEPAEVDRQTFARLLDISPRPDLLHLGGDARDYGAWVVAADRLGPESVCCLAGVGEDITFDCALVTRFGCRACQLDPTPRAIHHVVELGRLLARGDIDPADPVFGKYAGLTPEVFARLTHHPLGLYSRQAVLRFHAPTNPEHVSHSIFNLQKTTATFEAPCLGVADLPWLLGSRHIDLLKLDIEGAEYPVVEALIEADLDVRQLLIEFDEGYQPLDRQFLTRMADCVTGLGRAGFRAVCLDGWNVTFVHHRAPRATKGSPR